MEKKGQFYLISAIVLGFVIIGIVSITNYIGKDANPRIEDLNEELKIESRSFLEYGLNNSLSDSAFNTNFGTFASDYVSYVKSEVDIYLIFGDSSDLTVAGSQKEAQTVILAGSGNTTITETAGEFNQNLNPGGSSIRLYFGEDYRDFTLRNGKNIYFLLSEELNSNRYVIVG